MIQRVAGIIPGQTANRQSLAISKPFSHLMRNRTEIGPVHRGGASGHTVLLRAEVRPLHFSKIFITYKLTPSSYSTLFKTDIIILVLQTKMLYDFPKFAQF